MFAGQQADYALLRRALSIQGLILAATRNTPDALLGLMEALDTAESLGDQRGRFAAAWLNMGITFFDAALFPDARVCYVSVRQVSVVFGVDNRWLQLRSRALLGAALCGLANEYLQGVDACSEGAVELLARACRIASRRRPPGRSTEATYVAVAAGLEPQWPTRLERAAIAQSDGRAGSGVGRGH